MSITPVTGLKLKGAGVVRPHVGLEDKAIAWEMCENLADGSSTSTVSLDVGALSGDRQVLRHDKGQSFVRPELISKTVRPELVEEPVLSLSKGEP